MAGSDPQSIQGPYNATAPEPVAQREFARTLARVLHRPSVMPTPAFALRALMGEQSAMVLEGQRVWPARLQQSGYQFRFPILEAALRDLC